MSALAEGQPITKISFFEPILQAMGLEMVDPGQDRVRQFHQLIAAANRTIHIATGNYRLDFYGNICPRDLIERQVIHGVQLEFAVIDPSLDPREIGTHMQARVPDLVALKAKYQDHIHLYWSREQTPSYFAVVDSYSTMVEDPQQGEGENPMALFLYRDKKWAQEWEARFDQIRANSTEIPLV